LVFGFRKKRPALQVADLQGDTAGPTGAPWPRGTYTQVQACSSANGDGTSRIPAGVSASSPIGFARFPLVIALCYSR
jgi:hypothetical protein